MHCAAVSITHQQWHGIVKRSERLAKLYAALRSTEDCLCRLGERLDLHSCVGISQRQLVVLQLCQGSCNVLQNLEQPELCDVVVVACELVQSEPCKVSHKCRQLTITLLYAAKLCNLQPARDGTVSVGTTSTTRAYTYAAA